MLYTNHISFVSAVVTVVSSQFIINTAGQRCEVSRLRVSVRQERKRSMEEITFRQIISSIDLFLSYRTDSTDSRTI